MEEVKGKEREKGNREKALPFQPKDKESLLQHWHVRLGLEERNLIMPKPRTISALDIIVPWEKKPPFEKQTRVSQV